MSRSANLESQTVVVANSSYEARDKIESIRAVHNGRGNLASGYAVDIRGESPHKPHLPFRMEKVRHSSVEREAGVFYCAERRAGVRISCRLQAARLKKPKTAPVMRSRSSVAQRT